LHVSTANLILTYFNVWRCPELLTERIHDSYVSLIERRVLDHAYPGERPVATLKRVAPKHNSWKIPLLCHVAEIAKCQRVSLAELSAAIMAEMRLQQVAFLPNFYKERPTPPRYAPLLRSVLLHEDAAAARAAAAPAVHLAGSARQRRLTNCCAGRSMNDIWKQSRRGR
jgi:hypothetical protein